MRKRTVWMVSGIVAVMALLIAGNAFAHCDTMDGPVIGAAQKSLSTGKVDHVLVWVQKKDEGEIRKAFQETLNFRKLGPQAKDLADRYFFETLVRIHRAGEGAPFTGIQPAGTDLGPAVKEADEALETGSADRLVKLVNDEAAQGIRERFARTMERRRHASHGVDAGRAYVASYVDYVHYVEGLYDKAASGAGHHGEAHGAEASGHAH